MSVTTPRSYDEAAQVLAGGRNKSSRKIANNTWLERRGENAIAVRLHQTDVVTWTENGDIVFNTGRWNTSTTRSRLNAYAPNGIQFYTRKGQLYVRDRIAGWEQPMGDVFTLGLSVA